MARSSFYLIWHAGIVVLLGCAGTWENASRKSAAHVSWAVHKALQLTTLAHMQQLEAEQVSQQANAAERQADREETQAEMLEQKGKLAADVASRFENREFYWHHLWEEEMLQVKEMEDKAEKDTDLYNQLCSKVATDIKQENKDLENLRTVHTGLCGIMGFRAMCGWVGHATATQQQVDAEQLQIHDEWKQAQEAGKREYLEELAVDLMDQKATQYNRTSFYLGLLVDWYHDEQEAFFAQAQTDEKTAEELQKQSENFRKQAQQDIDWQQRNTEQANAMLHRAQSDRKAAHNYAIAAVVAASLALVLALFKALPNFELSIVSADKLPCSQPPDPVSVAIGVGHWLVVLMIALLNKSYLMHLEEYSSEKRAVLVFWIALCSVILHVLIWLAYFRDTQIIWKSLAHWSCVWLVLVTIEFLSARLVVGQWSANPLGPAAWLSIVLSMCSIAALWPTIIHWVSLMTNTSMPSDDSTMYSKRDDDSGLFSEVSPLHTDSSVGHNAAKAAGYSYSTTPTEEFDQLGMELNMLFMQSREVPEPMSWSAQLSRLLLPLELLLVSLSLKYIHGGMVLVFTASHLALMEMTLLIVALLMALVWTITRPISEISGSMSENLKLQVSV